jgi:hypothetical protein
MAVTNNFAASVLDLNGTTSLQNPTQLVWGPDGRLYVTEVSGGVKVLTVAFGDKNPADADPAAQFYVTSALSLDHITKIQNFNDDGSLNTSTKRQVTGLDVTKQYDADGVQMFFDGKPAVTIYGTSSDSALVVVRRQEDRRGDHRRLRHCLQRCFLRRHRACGCEGIDQCTVVDEVRRPRHRPGRQAVRRIGHRRDGTERKLVVAGEGIAVRVVGVGEQVRDVPRRLAGTEG